MVATEDGTHTHHLVSLDAFDISLLPIAAIYGANASGKSNFFSAIHFAKRMVVRGSQPSRLIPIQPFRLEPSAARNPVDFDFDILVDDTIYNFRFAANNRRVIRESLTAIQPAGETTLYERHREKTIFHSSLRGRKDLQYASKGTRDNQLLLTNTVSQNIDRFRPVYDWFDNTLTLIAPDARFQRFDLFFDDSEKLSITSKALLDHLDTGISDLGGETIPFDQTQFSQFIRDELDERITDDIVARIWSDDHSERYVVRRENGQLVATRLVTYHQGESESLKKFDMRDESDGTKRIIDLIPVFHQLSTADSDAVFVIDEIDRSLHSLVTRRLIELYLDAHQQASRSQLLCTTHDIDVMDLGLLRTDEMWLCERDRSGASSLSTIADFREVSPELDVRANYLQGRFGGIPRMLLGDAWPNPLKGLGPRRGK